VTNIKNSPKNVSKSASKAFLKVKPETARAKAKPLPAKKATPARRGRPSIFTPELAESLCDLIADGKSSRQVCSELALSERVLFNWLKKDAEFMQQYAHAREMQADLLFDQIIAIADTPLMGTKTVAKEWGLEVTTGDMIEHRRLQVDARKWLVVQLAPKKYGDKLQVGGAEDLPSLKHETTMNLTADEAYKRMLGITNF
jgi:hypothetical protein